MRQNSLVAIVHDQTRRALWEMENVIDCIPDDLWRKSYCDMPMWKHAYHMIHSLDQWFVNPRDPAFQEPPFHEPGLNDLDTHSSKELGRHEIMEYCRATADNTVQYLDQLDDEALLQMPPNCEYTKFTLILAQHRHLHCHMGMIMGFIIEDVGKWPRVLGLEGKFLSGDYEKYF